MTQTKPPSSPRTTARFAALLAIVILAALATVGIAYGTSGQLRSVAPAGGLLAVALLARLLLFARKDGDDGRPD
ncbi:hypothetical protein PSA7680_00951 [Pseudoruegeria aquimaris]|uniref:Uncharacterized protein n=1 Tax=Pseudoruegeria aquimaris TaxID=393663 RepID=A0A1Y5RRC1_9RHOB|nr:hypothetical protein [Pseudoruegeria aquimaris]SLN23116.1 hypothetical protein PSA7680_00951 [Pseudoruegeria aquimaris]